MSKAMKKVTLNRNGQTHARVREVSDLKAGQFQVGQHVMLRITGDGSITYVGQYLQPNGQPNARPKRVYRIAVISNDAGFPGEWCADIIEDQNILVKISGFSKWQVAYGALGALKGILHKRCTHTSVNRRARRHAAESAAKEIN